MTTIEHRELKGITVKNLVVTIMSTASIVASVMTTYFGLKDDIHAIKNSQETESRINNIRIKVLEDEVSLLQKQVDEIKICTANTSPNKNPSALKTTGTVLLSAVAAK
ncbi:hypothetical protein JN11_01857 [Mucilaginibacter frigoritolerans]|uniref:Uncharacterized protein n=1 Tax=Mucilaginibacter frigoritolerans TaxID=652788 RepID=A0A562U790_9SPHI|nr:hypothetical protein [Mucilaginibacter frigoritolerans]TWJ01703.1 hypothetical protein JN11_01857 [Mucilaginibacter frigoritolerans]